MVFPVARLWFWWMVDECLVDGGYWIVDGGWWMMAWLVDIGFWIMDGNGGWSQMSLVSSPMVVVSSPLDDIWMSVMIIIDGCGHLGKRWFGEISVKSALPK